ncbi:MAG TPA: rod shape-determining protein MreC [Candidatus Staskawiczbacteria bacterium]|nr:rod shape-determining protein MreC [Candidatus Staskawiczbacteria bacterium]
MNWDINVLNKKKNFLPKFLAAVTVLALCVFLLMIFTAPVKNFFHNVSFPLQGKLSLLGQNGSAWLGSVFNSSDMQQENETLRQENKKLLAKISDLQSIQEGNKALSAISQSCQENNFTTVMAGITGLNDQDIVSINKGSDDGISEGMPVIDQNNVLYGKVYKVFKDFSQVMLISSKNSTINAQAQRDVKSEAANGIVKGSGGLSVYLDLVPVNLDLQNGEILITSALDQTFPKNLLIGKIYQVDKNDQKPFQQAQIDPFFSLDQVENLFVITNYKSGQ